MLSHISSQFGNAAGKVEAATVKSVRDESKDRNEPWNGDEELDKLK